MNLNGKAPSVAQNAFVAPGASVIGDVKVGANSSIWYGCVLRGKPENTDKNSFNILIECSSLCVSHKTWKLAFFTGDVNSISVGSETNIQDNTLVHVAQTNISGNVRPTVIGSRVTIGKSF